jgi:hypothetical protein
MHCYDNIKSVATNLSAANLLNAAAQAKLGMAGVLATRALDVLFKVRLGSSWLCLKDTAGSRDTACSHLAGVHIRGVAYSRRHAPRVATEAYTRPPRRAGTHLSQLRDEPSE